MKKKNLLVMAIGLLGVASLVGCGKKNEQTPTADYTDLSATTTVKEETEASDIFIRVNSQDETVTVDQLFTYLRTASDGVHAPFYDRGSYTYTLANEFSSVLVEDTTNGVSTFYGNSPFNLADNNKYTVEWDIINGFGSNGLDDYYTDYKTYTDIENIMVERYGVATEFNEINSDYVNVAICDLFGLNGKEGTEMSMSDGVMREAFDWGIKTNFGIEKNPYTNAFGDITNSAELYYVYGFDINYLFAHRFLGYELDTEIQYYEDTEVFLQDQTLAEKNAEIKALLEENGYVAFEPNNLVAVVDYDSYLIHNIKVYVTKPDATRHYSTDRQLASLTDENKQTIIDIYKVTPTMCIKENEGKTTEQLLQIYCDKCADENISAEELDKYFADYDTSVKYDIFKENGGDTKAIEKGTELANILLGGK